MWEDSPRAEPTISIPVLKQSRFISNTRYIRKSHPLRKRRPKPPRSAIVVTNPIDGPIISPAPIKKRTYSSRYKSNSSISSTTNYKSSLDSSSELDLDSLYDSRIPNCEDRPRKRQKRKLNPKAIAYYHRYLGHSRDIR